MNLLQSEASTEFMQPPTVDLSAYDNSSYSPGRPQWVQTLWFFFGLPLLRSSWIPFSAVRRVLLGLFGAKIGLGVVIKPGTRVKYPWLLQVGDHSWIGEDAWIDNLVQIQIGANVCISQGAYLCTGNHDWSDPAFRLVTAPIVIGDGAWIGAKVVVCPGTVIAQGAVAAAGSVVTKHLESNTIYAGNPARAVKIRNVRMPDSISEQQVL